MLNVINLESTEWKVVLALYKKEKQMCYIVYSKNIIKWPDAVVSWVFTTLFRKYFIFLVRDCFGIVFCFI